MSWFTSDTHFNHANIIKFCGRPFKDVFDMNDKLIKNWNARVKENDTVYCIGDFCFRGGTQGGKSPAQIFEDQLNGKIIHIRGNHDINNGVNSLITYAIMEFGRKQVVVTHVPPTMEPEVPEFCDFVICGHVHEKWKFKYDNTFKVPFINVGVDVWKFMPISIQEILVFYDQIVSGKGSEYYREGKS